MYGRRCGRNSRQLPPLPQSSDDDEDEDEEQEEEDEDAADRGGAGGARGRAPSSPPVSFKVNQSELNAGFLKLSALVKPLLDKVKQHFAGDPAKQKTALQEIISLKTSMVKDIQKPRVLGLLSALNAPLTFEQAMDAFDVDFQHYAPTTWPWD